MTKYVKKLMRLKYTKYVIWAVFLLTMCLINIDSKLSGYIPYKNFKSNIRLISKFINATFPVLIIVILYIIYKVYRKKWVFRVEKVSIGGINIIIDDPEKLFKQQIRNFLNTKRTLFKIDENRDNLYETLDSYFSVYNFLREEMKIFDESRVKDSEQYKIANTMIKKLNDFLTSYQNNFRRWYNHVIDECYNKDISEMQRDYRHYSEMISECKNLNKYFCKVSEKFDINIAKWED